MSPRPRRPAWAIYSARRMLDVLEQDPSDAYDHAGALAPRIADIAMKIGELEQRRGPREIALFMLRNITGRHAVAIIEAVFNSEVEDAAKTLLGWAQAGPTLALDNPSPARTPPTYLRMTIFNRDGTRERFHRIPSDSDGDPARHGGRR